MADEQIVTNIVANADFSGLTSDLKRITAQLATLQEQANATNKSLSNQISVMNRQFGDTLRSTGQFSSHFVTIGSDVEKFGKNLDAGRGRLRDFYGAWQGYHRQAGGLIKDLAKQQVQLQNSILQPLGKNADGMMKFAVHVPRGLDEIKNKTSLAKQELMIMNKVVQEGANQLINWGKNTQWAGRQLTVGLTVPLTVFGKAAADAFRQADEQLTRLTKVYGDLSQTSSAQLLKVRRDVSETAKTLASSMGASYKDTLALSADIAATGKTGNELLGSIQETTRLSILGEVDRQEAMKATLAIQSAFKQNTEELAGSINFLNAVENQTSTSLSDLVEAIPKAGPVVKGLGGSIKDLALYLTAMREGGINAAEGANALKSGLASLINPTNVAVNQFKSFGIDLLGIVNNNAGNVTGTLLELQKALDKLDPLQKQQAIEQLFGKFQFARMNALFENLGKQGSQTLKVLDLMKASTDDLANLAGRELAQVTESASGKYRRALEELKADLASVGEQFLAINTFLLKFVDKIVDFANNLPGPIKAILGFLGGLTALAGPLIMLTGVLGNFFGYIIKGVSHFKALFKGAEGWKMLTPEIMAANNAGELAQQTFYSDAKAAQVLNQALRDLSSQYDALAVRAQSGAVSVSPILNNIATSARVVDPNNPLAGSMGTRASGHMVPRKADQPRSIFGLVPTSIPVNAAIGENPMIYSEGNLPDVQGLTTISATRTIGGQKRTIPVSTGIVASEAAKHHAYQAALAMQSKQEFEALKKTLATTGAASQEFINTFDDILPITSQLTAKAAAQSAGIVAELKAGKLNVAQAREQIIALNVAIEKEMGVAVSAYAANAGRSINLMNVPTLNQPVQSAAGKSNMRELFKQRQGGIFNRLAESLGVRTSGAGYNIQTTMPKRLALGGVGIQKLANGYTSIRAAMKAAAMLRSFNKTSSMIGGLRKVGARSNRSGGEAGVDNTFGSIYRRPSSIWKDPEYQAYGLSATSGDDYLVHGMVPGFLNRTRGLEKRGSSVVLPRDRYSEFNLQMDPRTLAHNESLQLLPTQFIKNTRSFNTALSKGYANAGMFRPVDGSDMVSLLLFLKSQGVKPHQAKIIADRAAQVLNYKISTHKGPITEAVFGKFLNNASVRAIQSGAKPNMVGVRDPFGYDAHTTNRGSAPLGLKETSQYGVPGFAGGVTKLPGFGGGDTIPALLEPGESVVTKHGTRGNEGALALMNRGYSVDSIMGFENGVVGAYAAGVKNPYGKNISINPMSPMSQMGIGMAGMAAGSMVGGNTGMAIMMASNILPMMTGLTKLGGLLPMATKLAGVLGRLTIPGAVIGSLFLVGKKLMDIKQNAEDAGKANRLAFGGTSESFASVGIKKYISLSDRFKNLTKEMELNRAKTLSSYNSFTKAKGPSGLTLTIKELDDAIKNAGQNQKEYVEGFNNISSDRVVKYASEIKAQFLAMGMSASEATNQIYAIVKASDKAGQATEAVSSKSFRAMQDMTSGIKFMTTGLKNHLKSGGFNAEEFATGIDTLANSLLNYQQSLIGTKSKSGEILDDMDAMKIAIDKIVSVQGSMNRLSSSQIDSLKNQDMIYAAILNKNESLQSITAKIMIYQAGFGNMVDLSRMGAQETLNFANNLKLVQDAMVEMTSRTGADDTNPLKPLARLLAQTKKENANAQAAVKKMKAIDEDAINAKIKNHQRAIDKIKEEADARLKLLEIEQQRVDYEDELSKAKLRYEQAVANGDMAQAAQEQLSVQKLISDRQRSLTSQSIQDKANAEIKALEDKIKKLQDALENAKKGSAAVTATATKTSANEALLQSYMDKLNRIAIKNIGVNKMSDEDKQEIAVILNDMMKEGGKVAKAATDIRSSVGVVNTHPKGTLTWQDKLISSMKNEVAEGKFKTAVDAFSSAVGAFAVSTGIVGKNKQYNTYDEMLALAGGRTHAVGGYISGPGTGTSDSIPAMLSNGEYVINSRSVKNIGVPMLDNINKYAAGGFVTNYSVPSTSTPRIRMNSGGLASSSNSLYNINVTLSGSNMDPNDVARAISRELKLREAMNGRSVTR